METKTGEYKGVRYSLFPKHGDTPSQRRLGQAGKWCGVHFVYAYETTVEVGRGAGTEREAMAAVHRYIDDNNPVGKTFEEGVRKRVVTPPIARTFVHHDVPQVSTKVDKVDERKGINAVPLTFIVLGILLYLLWYFVLGNIRRG